MSQVQRCSGCGFRIRGENHEKGGHHKRDSNVVSGARIHRKSQAVQQAGHKTNIGMPTKRK